MSAMVSDGLDLSPIFGPIYWGTVISLLLGGMSIIQGYIYFTNAHDHTAVRVVAGSMLVLDIASSALVVQSVYYYLVPHFGSLSPFTSITPELSGECFLSRIITFISQLSFAAQIYTVTKSGTGSWIVPTVVVLFSILAFVFGVACSTVMFIYHHDILMDRNSIFSIFFGLATGFGAVTDIIATIAMSVLLSDAKTGIKQTNSLLNSLIQFVVRRGALVTLIQTLILIMFYALPQHLYWLALHVNSTKLYVNTFFAMLNFRGRLRKKHSVHVSSPLGTQSFFGRENKGRQAGGNPSAYAPDLETEGKTCNVIPMPTITKTVVIADL